MTTGWQFQLTLVLPQRMEDMDVKGAVQCVSELGHIFSCQFVGLEDGFCIPVSPVDVVLEDRNGKRVSQILTRKLMNGCAIQVRVAVTHNGSLLNETHHTDSTND